MSIFETGMELKFGFPAVEWQHAEEASFAAEDRSVFSTGRIESSL